MRTRFSRKGLSLAVQGQVCGGGQFFFTFSFLSNLTSYHFLRFVNQVQTSKEVWCHFQEVWRLDVHSFHLNFYQKVCWLGRPPLQIARRQGRQGACSRYCQPSCQSWGGQFWNWPSIASHCHYSFWSSPPSLIGWQWNDDYSLCIFVSVYIISVIRNVLVGNTNLFTSF